MNLTPVAIAILKREGKFLMQLRDNIPGIAYPGYWGFFGGHLEPGESPKTAIKRELLEEINYKIDQPLEFGCYADQKIMRHVFYSPLLLDMGSLKLNEGWDLDLLSPEDIYCGYHYSKRAGEERPIGDIHQKILLDFIKSNI